MNFAEIKAFETNRFVFTFMGISKPQTTVRFVGKLSIAFGIIIIVLMALATMFSVTFVYKNLSVDMEKALSAVFQVSGLCSSIHIMICALAHRRQIAQIISATQRIYDACKHFVCINVECKGRFELNIFAGRSHKAFDFIWIAHNRGESISKFLIKYAFIASTLSSIPMAIISVVYCQFTYGELRVDHLYIPLRYRYFEGLAWISKDL